MSDVIDAKTGEVLEESKPDALMLLVKDADKPVARAMEGVASLDWRDLKPNQTAILLMQKPMAVSGGGTMYLNFKQALYFAVRSYELGISPFSSGVWFDPNRYSVNLTLEGKRELARLRGIDLGPPQFEELKRNWDDVAKMTEAGEAAKKSGFKFDVGIKCRMRVGDPKNSEFCEYIAWLSDWYVSRSPVWNAKPVHMLQTRATEKAISLCLGTGASAMPDEKELE